MTAQGVVRLSLNLMDGNLTPSLKSLLLPSSQAAWENPLMGWTSTGDVLEGIRSENGLAFYTKEEAIKFCQKHGWDFEVRLSRSARMPMSVHVHTYTHTHIHTNSRTPMYPPPYTKILFGFFDSPPQTSSPWIVV